MTDTQSTTFIPLKISESSSTALKDEKTYVFDIDETLYLCNDAIKKLRRTHMIEFLKENGFSEDKANAELDRFASVYGLEVRGLTKEMNIRGELLRKLAYPYPGSINLIRKDIELKELLKKLKGRKVCLTNGNADHAKEILTKLGIINSFEVIFHCDYEEEDFIAKPDKEVFLAVQNYLGVKPEQITFFDDLEIHIEAAKGLGWNAYKVESGITVAEILKTLVDN